MDIGKVYKKEGGIQEKYIKRKDGYRKSVSKGRMDIGKVYKKEGWIQEKCIKRKDGYRKSV